MSCYLVLISSDLTLSEPSARQLIAGTANWVATRFTEHDPLRRGFDQSRRTRLRDEMTSEYDVSDVIRAFRGANQTRWRKQN